MASTITKVLGELPDRVSEGLIESGTFKKFDVLEVTTDATDLASIADGAALATTITDATGVNVGDIVLGVAPQAASTDAIFNTGVFIVGHVGDADEITYVVTNRSGGAVDAASQTFKIYVLKLAAS